ncbi:NAD-dependent epimerase/dehydratase family protein [uncultured Bacteroides sp.]|uniref:NAD-dependent epimerase/dehydratase family protein n=1 Tax=uncultured Bacteroides sp. TaxID=162156 RepID=UPI002AAA9406|nr:NAD-dependent epimerase/dehydratase family protein [uncultured Bacteroides sp.]
MRILVLGGTGAMGEHLVELLSRNGYETFVTTRSKRTSVKGIHYIQGNAHDFDFLQTMLEEHWDAIVDFMVYTTASFRERINLLLDATTQYVFLSSSRVYADSNGPITETSPRLLDISQDKEYLLTDEYALTKARQEDLLKKTERKNWTIIRPYITYSENRLQLGVLEKDEWLYRALHGRTIVFSSDISSRLTTLTYGLDVAKGILAIIGHSTALGEAFHIAVNESVTWNKVLSIYLDVLEKKMGYRPKVLLDDIEPFIEIHPAKYQIIYDRLYDRQFDNSKISQYLDLNDFSSIEIGIKKCLESFFKNRKFNNINWVLEAKKDKLVGERTPLKEILRIKQKMKYLLYRYIL